MGAACKKSACMQKARQAKRIPLTITNNNNSQEIREEIYER